MAGGLPHASFTCDTSLPITCDTKPAYLCADHLQHKRSKHAARRQQNAAEPLDIITGGVVWGGVCANVRKNLQTYTCARKHDPHHHHGRGGVSCLSAGSHRKEQDLRAEMLDELSRRGRPLRDGMAELLRCRGASERLTGLPSHGFNQLACHRFEEHGNYDEQLS